MTCWATEKPKYDCGRPNLMTGTDVSTLNASSPLGTDTIIIIISCSSRGPPNRVRFIVNGEQFELEEEIPSLKTERSPMECSWR